MIYFIGEPNVDQASDGGFEQPAEALDRIELRAVGRQR